MIIIASFLLVIYELWIFTHAGKLIIKANIGKGWTIFWVGFLIFWFLLYWSNKKPITNITCALNILGVLIAVVAIIRSRMDKEIRENGIYCNSSFYKWSQIKSYNWISANIIQFKTGASLLSDGSFEFIFKEDSKSKVDEVLKKCITS